MQSLITESLRSNLISLKDNLFELCTLLKNSSIHSEIITQQYSKIETIDDLNIPYLNFYYDDDDISGNKVNTYYGYICCKPNKLIADKVSLVNLLKETLSNSLKDLSLHYKSNPPKLNKLIASLDVDGRINLKELLRKIVIVESDEKEIHRVSFQIETINKGKGRCLTAGEIKFVINNYFNGGLGKYVQDLNILNSIPPNELLSPIGAERRKCRVNIRIENETVKGKYCSIPIIILGYPSRKFKTNINTIFEKSFKKTRDDQQLEEKPLLAFRSFTRKKVGYKHFLTNEELITRKEYLIKSFKKEQ